MIVLCVGMPRAGSGWHYNLVHDLMGAAGADEARDIRTRFRLQGILTEVNCNIGVLSLRRLAMVSVPALLGRTFVIKAHAGPTAAWRLLQSAGLLRTLYIYRDPRDCMLSAFNYGQRALSKGRPNAFSHLTDFEQSLDFISDYVRIWDSWMRQKDVLVTRYEDLLSDYQAEAARIVGCLGLDASRPEICQVVDSYRPDKAEGQQGTHFFKGQVGRFRQGYSAEQQQELLQRLGPYLARMGYAA